MPMLASNVEVLSTNEGAEMVYRCASGFQPVEVLTAVCSSNATWLPDPTSHECTSAYKLIVHGCMESIQHDCNCEYDLAT